MSDRRPIVPPQPPRPQPGRPPTARPTLAGEPTTAFCFAVALDGEDLALARIEGLDLAADPASLKPVRDPRGDGQQGWTALPLPGRLLLRRAIDGDRRLYTWRREAIAGKAAVKDLAIRQLDRAFATTLNTWRVVGAWPLRWSGPVFDAGVADFAFEELELVFVDLDWL